MSDKEIKDRLEKALSLLKPIIKENQESWLDKKFGQGYMDRRIKGITDSIKHILEEGY